MKRFTKILTATCAALALTSSLALAAEPVAKDAPKPVPAPAGPHAGHGKGAQMGMGAGMGAGMGHGALSALTPEKQELARTLMAAHSKAMAPLHQSLYAKNAALEALNAAGEGDSAKAKAVIREIADLNAKMLTENAKFRAQMVKQTGLRTPVMGHGPMGMGMMGGKGGMMGGKGGMMGGMSCPMMQNMQHGQPAPAAPAGATAPAPAAPAGEAHTDHGK